MATKKTATLDASKNPLQLVVHEVREHGYFHLYARVTTQRYDQGTSSWVPYGPDDDYSDGPLWSGLRISCQGDDRTQRGTEPVYGYSCEYHDVYSLALRKVRRMAKTLETIERGLEKCASARGYVRSYGEYLGRVAEILGCEGIGFERSARSRDVTGQRWQWGTVGEGVNRANHAIFLWQQEAIERDAQANGTIETGGRRQLGAGDGAEVSAS